MNENNTRVTDTSPLLAKDKSMTSYLQPGRYSAANKQDNNGTRTTVISCLLEAAEAAESTAMKDTMKDDEADAQTHSHHDRMYMALYTEMAYLNTKDDDQSLSVAEGIARQTIQWGNAPLPIQARCHIKLATLDDDDSLFHAHEAVRLAEMDLKGPIAHSLYAEAMSVLEHVKTAAAERLNQGDQEE